MKRIIQVGVGGMGECWTRRVGLSEDWEAAAYVDVNPKALVAAAKRHGIPESRCFTDLERALGEVEADALLDVTPQQFRRKVCCAAFRRGLHVLAEKPLADSLKNAKAIVAAAEKEGRTLMIAQNYRYQAITQTAKRYAQGGRLGAIGYVGVSFHKGPHFGGFREVMAYPLVLDMSIHHFDMMRCILGADIKRVQAKSVSAPWNWNKGAATVLAQLEMTNGVPVNYFASWVASGWETPWNADWRFEGAQGVLLWENDVLYFANKPGTRRKVPLMAFPVEHQDYLLKVFRECLDKGAEPETSGRRNLNSFATTYAAIEASKKGGWVEVDGLLL